MWIRYGVKVASTNAATINRIMTNAKDRIRSFTGVFNRSNALSNDFLEIIAEISLISIFVTRNAPVNENINARSSNIPWKVIDTNAFRKFCVENMYPTRTPLSTVLMIDGIDRNRPIPTMYMSDRKLLVNRTIMLSLALLFNGAIVETCPIRLPAS